MSLPQKMKRRCRPKLDAETIARIEELARQGKSIREVAREVGLAPSTTTPYWQRAKGNARPFNEGAITRKESKDECQIEFATRKRILTLEDALAHAKVDLKTWWVFSYEITDWEMGWVSGSPQEREAHVQPLHRVKLNLRRIAPKAILDGIRIIKEELAAYAPSYDLPPFPQGYGRPVLAELDLFDWHAGKLAHAPETGGNYDLKIADKVFREAVEDLVGLAKGFNIERFLLPVGNDLFHIDGRRYQTSNGTQMEVDGRFSKIWATGKLAFIWAIDYLIQFAPVDVVWVPGNHDFHLSYFLCDALHGWFRNTDRVTVDASPSTRKLYHYYANLVMFVHGDKVPQEGIKVLPDILTGMAMQQNIDLREIVCREAHVGHRHTQRGFTQRDLEEIRGCKVRWLSSISETDLWHYENLYVGNARCAESFIYDRDKGCVAHFNAPVRSKSLEMAS